MGQGGAAEIGESLVVVHRFPTEDAAMAVRGVFAHTHIGDEIDLFAVFLPDGPQSLLNNAVLCISAAAFRVFAGGQAEEQEFVDPVAQGFLNAPGDFIGAVMEVAGQTGDGGADLFPFLQKQRQNQALGTHAGLPHHATEQGSGAETAGTINHGKNLLSMYLSWNRWWLPGTE